jgi:hypothetical protein
MKILFLAVLLMATFSCSKTTENCWVCRCYRAGVVDEIRTLCSEEANPPQQFDNNGNPLNMTCSRK